MKSRIVYSMVLCGLILLTVVLEALDFQTKPPRVHQHLDMPGPLPVITINTHGQDIPGVPNDSGIQEAVKVDFNIADQDLQTQAMVHYRGNSSKWFDKKSMLVKLVDNKGNKDPQSLAGLPAHDEWVLNGPFLDRTLIRNYMAYNIAGEIMAYAPGVRFCELVVDDVYKGVYLIVESIAEDEARISLTKPEKNKSRTSYMVKLDRKGKGDHEINNFTNYTLELEGSAMDVIYPGRNSITPERMAYIEADISKVEKLLYSYDLLGAKADYQDYIDIQAFAQYFIINEFFKNTDAGWFSTYYYKDIRGKIKPCVWDFNNMCNNYIEYAQDEAGFTMIDSPWFERLIRDEAFVDEIVSQYRTLRKGVLSEAYLLEYIDETVAYLGEAIDRNYKVWGYVFDLEQVDTLNYLIPVERNYTSYEQALEQLKTYVVARGKWLDAHIDTLYQYTSASKNVHLNTP